MALHRRDGEGSEGEGCRGFGDVQSDVAGGELGRERVWDSGGIGAGDDGELSERDIAVVVGNANTLPSDHKLAVEAGVLLMMADWTVTSWDRGAWSRRRSIKLALGRWRV